MHALHIDFSLTDGIILLILAIILGFVVHFVLVSRRKLQSMIEESKKQTSLTGSGGRSFEEPLKPKWTEKKRLFPEDIKLPYAVLKGYKTAAPSTAVAPVPDVLHDLKQTIHKQQKTLDQLLSRVNKLDAAEEQSETEAAAAARALEEREAELQKTKQQLSMSQKVASRVTEVYEEFDLLQQKLAELEESAGRTTKLELELDDMQQAYVQLQKEATRKQDKLQDAVNAAQALRDQLADTEDKLSEISLQRQQLQKRVQMLENMNSELQQTSDVNKKLKTELRRIAELESMLSLVSDERDILLKKRLS